MKTIRWAAALCTALGIGACMLPPGTCVTGTYGSIGATVKQEQEDTQIITTHVGRDTCWANVLLCG